MRVADVHTSLQRKLVLAVAVLLVQARSEMPNPPNQASGLYQFGMVLDLTLTFRNTMATKVYPGVDYVCICFSRGA